MRNEEKYPTNREIIYLLGVGTLLLGTILMPGLGFATGAIMRAKSKHEFEKAQKEWKKFNLRLLRRNIKRLQAQQVVKIIEKDGEEIIKLTQKGHTKYLSCKFEELSLKGGAWDRKWRLVIYDIGKMKKFARESLRKTLTQIKFLQLQKSVYLTPYKCQEEIEYLRKYFGVENEVKLLEVNKLENEDYYKQYFGLQ